MSRVYSNATVLPMVGDTVLQNTTVVVRDGRIDAVHPAGADAAYGDMPVIDCSGKTVLPALWDMHTHIFNDEFLDYLLSYGVVATLNMWGFKKHLRWQRQLASGARVGPDLYTTGPIIDSYPIYPLICLAKTEDEARKAVRDTKAAGYAFVKIYNNLSLEAYEAIMDEAQKLGIEVIGHLPNCINSDYTGEDRPYPIRQKTIEHLVFLHEGNIDAAIEAGVWLTPTFIVEKNMRHGPAPEADAALDELRPLVRNLYWKTLSGQHTKPRQGIQRTVRHDDEYHDKCFRLFREKGGRVLLGTDAGLPGVMPGFSLHQELECAVEHGMTPLEALRCVTLGAAQFMALDGQRGSIEPGKKAELLVLDGNPLEDIRNTRAIFALQKGELFWTADQLLGIRRKAFKRRELAVDTVFRRYMLQTPLRAVKRRLNKEK